MTFSSESEAPEWLDTLCGLRLWTELLYKVTSAIWDLQPFHIFTFPTQADAASAGGASTLGRSRLVDPLWRIQSNVLKERWEHTQPPHCCLSTHLNTQNLQKKEDWNDIFQALTTIIIQLYKLDNWA